MILNNSVALFVIAGVLSVIGNLGVINDDLRKIPVMIHYSGLALICIHTLLFIGWRTTLVIILVDLVVGFISFTAFSKR